MLLQSVGHFRGLLYRDEVVIDDPVFRLHYRVTSFILLLSSVLVTGGEKTV